jgi:serine/threonine-protein kinase
MFDDSAPASEDLSGTLIQAWQIESPIARGGLATDYLAHRADGQYSRQVALKVLRRGLDTDDLIRRFRAELQILSSLHHPAIAQLLDGGALKDGRPFLVMEFVDGLPINEFCKTKQLEIDSRIRLVIEVLDAVHHAHQHLVVHRDIKPSNILVSHEGRVTLLDFGIAKILDVGSIPVEISHTRTGVSLLTPGYGSPEQKMGHSVTTASDVYQVGGILFDLLAQSPPVRANGECIWSYA